MNKRLRWGLLAAGATLVAIIALLLWRLDADELRLRIAERISHTLQQPVNIGGAQLSLLHGLSFDLDRVEILPQGKHRLSLKADKMFVRLGLFKLLRGDVDVTSVFLLEPSIIVADETNQQTYIPAGLELQQLKIQNGKIWRESGEQFASNVFLDVRNILPGKNMRWELSAGIRDGYLRTFGHAALRGREFASAFGKLEIESVPVASLPVALPAWMAGRHVGCRLTFNLNHSGDWKLDGYLDINLPDHALADIQLRGEITGSTATGQFAWQDSFVHVGKGSVFTTHGEGFADGTLNVELRGKQLKLAELLAVTDIGWPVKSLAGIDAHLRFDGNSWLSQGTLELGKMQWKGASLPDLNVQFRKLQWDGERLDLAETQLSHPKKSGMIQLQSLQWSKNRLDLEMQLQAVEDWWTPLAGALLASQGVSDSLGGDGLLTGRLALKRNPEETSLDIEMDAAAASISYRSLNKAKNIESGGTISVQSQGDQTSWQLAHIRLGNSHLDKGEFQQDRQQQQLRLQGMQLDATELGTMGAWETVQAEKWRGQVSGDVHAMRSRQGAQRNIDNLASWLDSAEANLNMTQFGPDDTWSGDLVLRQGKASARQLTWSSGGVSVQMSGDVDLRNRSGRLDITQAAIDEARLSEIGGLLAKASLKGKLAGTKLTSKWFELRDGEARYRLRNGDLQLSKLQADVAGGQLRADNLSLNLADPMWPISIPSVHLNKAHLDDMAGGFQGRLFATFGISGHLLDGQWRANGDVEVYSGTMPGTNLAARLAMLTGIPYEKQNTGTNFDKLSARFRLLDGILRLPSIQVDSQAFSLKGAGKIDMDGIPDVHLDATLHTPLQVGLAAGKSYVEQDGSVHTPLLVSGKYPDLRFDLNEAKLEQIQAMKEAP